MTTNLINNEEILDLVAAKYDILEIMDILEWDMEDIVQKLSDDILENIHLFDDLDIE